MQVSGDIMNEFKVLVLSCSFGRIFKRPVKMLEKNGCKIAFGSVVGRSLQEGELVNLVADVDGIIVGNEKLTEKVISSAKKLKVISKHGAGVDNIDLNFASQKGIIVTNVPDANFNAVADLVFGLMIALTRKICVGNQEVRRGKWKRIIGTEICEKNLGVIGTGRAGKAVIKRAKGFDMKIFAHDIFEDEIFAAHYCFSYITLQKVLRNSDFLTIHVPLTRETRHLIGEEELNQMKKTAYLINTSRGEVVDEDALYKVLSEKRIAGAALDVYKDEPPVNSPLLKLDNVLLTPHIGAYTQKAIRKMGMSAAVNLMNILQGEKPLHQVTNVQSNSG